MKMMIRDKCGKMLGKYENGVIYLWCKSCSKEVGSKIADLLKMGKTGKQ